MADREDDTLSVDEVATLLRVDPATVQRELKAGRLPGNKVGKKLWRVHRDDLRGYLKGQQRDPRAAMEYAAFCFTVGDFAGGLRSLVSGLGYESVPPQLAVSMFRRVAALMDAVEASDPAKAAEIAERTRWEPDGDDAFALTYFPTVPGFSPPWTVKLPSVWNKMLHEFVYALRAHHRHRAAARSKLILRWEDNWGNSVVPPNDADQCRMAIEAVVPVGTLVIMARLNTWTVVKADAPPTLQVGSGPYDIGYEDVTELVRNSLAQAKLPAADYAADE